jgi:hypothetical protein
MRVILLPDSDRTCFDLFVSLLDNIRQQADDAPGDQAGRPGCSIIRR